MAWKIPRQGYFTGWIRKLDFISHSEGRVKKKTDGSYVYQYDLKDHLGNVRLTFSEETVTDTYLATLETDNAEVQINEENTFSNLDNSIRHLYANANATEPSITHPDPKYAARLNAVPAYWKTCKKNWTNIIHCGDRLCRKNQTIIFAL